MTGMQQPDRFRPGELDDADLGPGAEAELLGTARELEWLAAADDVGPSPDFADRVMAAVSREPAPRPIAAALGAARRRSPLAALAALGDLWRVAFTGGRPFAVRLPAMALVALLVVGSVGVGAIGAGAFVGLLGRAPDATPALSPSPLAPSSPEPDASPSPSDSLEPTDGPEASAATEGHSGGPAGMRSSAARPARTPDATDAPKATDTPGQTGTPSPGPTESSTPGPTPTPGESSVYRGGPGGG
ncbi:MAG TPA: hypothetical protein VIK16_02765 [Candidatus Limnocylindrales bacterium]